MPTTVDPTTLAIAASDIGVRNDYWSGFGKPDAVEFTGAIDVSRTGDDVKIVRSKSAIYPDSPQATATVSETALRRYAETGSDAVVSGLLGSVRTRRLSGRRLAILAVAALDLAS